MVDGALLCPECNQSNPAGKRFCGDCGAPLPVLCPACGVSNPPGKRFCGDCGALLTQVPPPPQPAPALSEGPALPTTADRHGAPSAAGVEIPSALSTPPDTPDSTSAPDPM